MKIITKERAKDLAKKGLIVAGAVGAVVLPEASFAMGTVGDTAIVAAFDSGTVSVGKVATGTIGMGAAFTGLGLVWRWLAR